MHFREGETMKNTHDTPAGWLHAARTRKHLLAREYYRGLDAKARDGISDEDYATTMTTLETMARNLGWDESHGRPDGPPFGRGRRGRGWHGHGRQHGHCQHEHEAREKPADV